MPTDRTRVALEIAMDAAALEKDDHAWGILFVLVNAMAAGLTESLADAVGEWDADQDRAEPVLPAWATAHDGRRPT
jgi:hypothetical protein